LELSGLLEFSKAYFRRNLPCRCCRDDDVVRLVSDDGGSPSAQRAHGEGRPYKGMRVEQDLHFNFNNSSSSSPLHPGGSGSQNESGISNPGVSITPRRFGLTGLMASIFATGFFSRPEVMITVCPFWAFFTSSERWVFASKIVAVMVEDLAMT